MAVYVGRRPSPWKRVLVPFSGGGASSDDGLHDRAALEHGARIAERVGAHTTVLHVVKPGRTAHDPRQGVAALVEPMGPERVTLKIVESETPLEAVVEEARQGYDLIVIGASGDWGLEPTIFGAQHVALAEVPASMLIVRRAAQGAPPVPKLAPARAAAT